MGTLRITWYSNAPWAGTGYGTQTAQVVKRLQAAAHKVAVLANYGLNGAPEVRDGISILPTGTETYSNDVLGPAHRLWLNSGDEPEPGWIITLFDVHVLDPKPLEGLHVASWTPVDHRPVPPKVADWARGHRTIAMSRFGQQMFADQGIASDYIPHAIEPVFRPTPSGIRDRLELPDEAFLILINAANKGNAPPRKAWNEMFAAIGECIKRHPETYVYCHTNPRFPGGVDLFLLCMLHGIPIDRMRWPDPFALASGGIYPEDLAELYSAADVQLLTSMGEGFGVPVLEGMACGLPAIVSDFSAQPEIIGTSGWKVACQPALDVGQGSLMVTPIIWDIIRKLDDAYDARGDVSVKQAAIDQAMTYDADLVFEQYWQPVLASMQAELTPPTRQQRRAKRRKAA